MSERREEGGERKGPVTAAHLEKGPGLFHCEDGDLVAEALGVDDGDFRERLGDEPLPLGGEVGLRGRAEYREQG